MPPFSLARIRAISLLLIPFVLLASDMLVAIHAEAAIKEKANQLAEDTTYTYDNNGNLLTESQSGGTSTYEYDGMNRLVKHTSPSNAITEYEYDGMNQRAARIDSIGTIRYFVDPFDTSGLPQVLSEYDPGNTTRTDYVYGLDLISMNQAGTLNYFIHDGQLSTRNLADDAGTLTDTFHYDAFGNLIHRTGTTAVNYLYNSQQIDPNLGFYYLRARYYNPDSGRFLSRDPHPGTPFDPASLHPYTYAHNNPVNRSDPSGEFSLGEAAIAAAISGVLAGLAVYLYTGSVKKALIAGVIVAVAVFAILAVFVVTPAAAGAAGASGTTGAASTTGTAATATANAAEVAEAVREFGVMIATGRIQQVTATFTAMLSTPQGRALIRGIHKVACSLLVTAGAQMPPDVFRTFQNLCDLSGPFVTGPP